LKLEGLRVWVWVRYICELKQADVKLDEVWGLGLRVWGLRFGFWV
jgi:hypothetical protein